MSTTYRVVGWNLGMAVVVAGGVMAMIRFVRRLMVGDEDHVGL